MTLINSNIKASTGKTGGGLFYASMTGDITLTINAGNVIASSISTLGGGGVAYFTGAGNTIVNINGPATSISLSSAKLSGGSFYLDGALSNSITFTDDV
jgi:hypothetical protein